MKNKVIILSGGLDSTVLLYHIVEKFGKERVKAITFDYNQRHSVEIEQAKKSCEKLGVNHIIIPIGFLSQLSDSSLVDKSVDVATGHYASENMKNTVVPNRNMILLSIASAYAMGKANADEIYYGAHSGDHTIYPDCRPEFIYNLSRAIEIADWNVVTLEAPFSNIDKSDIVKRGMELGVDFSLTHTCYNGTRPACGVCGSCNERLEAFEKNNIKDPIEYK